MDKARLAQMWMSWSPPGDCEKRAKTLELKSSILGKALSYNNAAATTPTPAAETPAPAAEAPPAPAPETPAPAPETPATTPEPVAEAKPEPVKAAPKAAPVKPAKAPAKPAPAPAKPLAQTAPKKLPPIGGDEVIVDPVNPVPCAGSLVPAKRGGRDVLICKTDAK